MTSDYYSRDIDLNSDGTQTFATEGDKANERRVDALIERLWNCTVHPLPALFPIDRYLEQHNRLVAYLEIKTANRRAADTTFAFLNHRKYLYLMSASLWTNVPGVFVHQNLDEVRWINVADVVPGEIEMGGTRTRVKSATDREPIIRIPLTDMTLLHTYTTTEGNT